MTPSDYLVKLQSVKSRLLTLKKYSVSYVIEPQAIMNKVSPLMPYSVLYGTTSYSSDSKIELREAYKLASKHHAVIRSNDLVTIKLARIISRINTDGSTTPIRRTEAPLIKLFIFFFSHGDTTRNLPFGRDDIDYRQLGVFNI